MHNFTKKGIANTNMLTQTKNCHYSKNDRKPAIPEKNDKPIMGLVS